MLGSRLDGYGRILDQRLSLGDLSLDRTDRRAGILRDLLRGGDHATRFRFACFTGLQERNGHVTGLREDIGKPETRAGYGRPDLSAILPHGRSDLVGSPTRNAKGSHC